MALMPWEGRGGASLLLTLIDPSLSLAARFASPRVVVGWAAWEARAALACAAEIQRLLSSCARHRSTDAVSGRWQLHESHNTFRRSLQAHAHSHTHNTNTRTRTHTQSLSLAVLACSLSPLWQRIGSCVYQMLSLAEPQGCSWGKEAQWRPESYNGSCFQSAVSLLNAERTLRHTTVEFAVRPIGQT